MSNELQVGLSCPFSMQMTASIILIRYVFHKVSACRCVLDVAGCTEVCGPWCDTSAMSAASLHSSCVRTAPTKRIRESLWRNTLALNITSNCGFPGTQHKLKFLDQTQVVYVCSKELNYITICFLFVKTKPLTTFYFLKTLCIPFLYDLSLSNQGNENIANNFMLIDMVTNSSANHCKKEVGVSEWIMKNHPSPWPWFWFHLLTNASLNLNECLTRILEHRS